MVASQIVKSKKDGEGNLVVADVAFLADRVPSVGYDTYYLEFTPDVAQPVATDLRIDERGLAMENDLLQVKVSPQHGAIISLLDKKTGRQMLDAQKGPFPVFKGRPNPDYPLRSEFVSGKYPKEDMVIPAFFDSSKSQAVIKEPKSQPGLAGAGSHKAAPAATDWRAVSKSDIQWIEKGPLRATIRTRHNWPLLKFEIHVTLYAHSPQVEVVTRLLPEIPPPPDKFEEHGGFPVRIKEGYWLTFAPGFEPGTVLRDFPLGIEPTTHDSLQGLTFLDLVGKEGGLLVLHAGTQYFNRDGDGVFSNLLLREWESFWIGEYGWPRYSEYRHALLPHGPNMANAQRLRASAEFTQKLLSVVGPPQSGSLPRRKGFITVGPETVQLSAFRKKKEKGYELRVVEVEGQEAAATVQLEVPVAGAVETNLIGKKVGEVSQHSNKLGFKIQPWKIRTFEVV
jgi:alpha-mannosidase